MLNLPHYSLKENLYQGTRTLVYRGQQNWDKKPVIIKVLRNPHPELDELIQFRNQYIITRHLQHPAIVQPLALERYGNGYALVMEDLGAIALSDYWQNSEQNLSNFLHIAIQLAEVLYYLSVQRIIHKDIKPTNILIHPETKQIQLIDFSISSLLPMEQQQLLNPNILEGTLAYISPEQTGRMNRGIDYRSDFYSLGVTFFELLSRQLPFDASDPMELVHCHLAQKVEFPVATQVPELLQEIVLKLMAKNAEDRYQSALGLKYDLQQCWQQLETTGEISSFELGERDVYDRFLLPEKLYGRETEVQTLLDAFERVSNPPQTIVGDPPQIIVGDPPPTPLGDPPQTILGNPPQTILGDPPQTPLGKGGGEGRAEMMLVAGFSGIGKTAVVNEVHKPIVRERGYFIKGKFDQFNRNIPFSAFVQAFRDLMNQLLSESDTELSAWKAQILNALGDNAQVIIEVVPELENIIGTQPPIPELSGSAAQNRFNLLFEKFIAVFTTAEHPLVIFLDDLQWADSASLNLMKVLMSGGETRYLLLLGAYRDNEVFPAHPLMLTLAELKQEQAVISTMTLAPLAVNHINQLVADTLQCSQQLAQPLSELVYQKTKGNPFFTTQFLKGLYEDELIKFNLKLGYWECDLVQVRDATITDDVVEFVAHRLQKLAVGTQEVLKLAACIGNRFDLQTLAVVCEKPEADVAADIWGGLQEGLILPISQNYKFFQGNVYETQTQTVVVSYRFLHDRVQQAAYSLIRSEQKQVTHLTIGRLLLQSIPENEQEEKIFSIVNQLNLGSKLIVEAREREDLAQLNLRAGEKAQLATAFTSAWEYGQKGIQLLSEKPWQEQYHLCLKLHELAVEGAYGAREFEICENLIQLVLKSAQTTLDKVRFYHTQIGIYVAQKRGMEAIEIGRQLLGMLGVELPNSLTEEELQDTLTTFKALIPEGGTEALLGLPTSVDPSVIAVMETLAKLSTPIFTSNPTLFPLLFVNLIKQTLKHGTTPYSAVGYSHYSLLCSALGDLEAGYQFGELALNILPRFNNKVVNTQVLCGAACTTHHWKIHLKETLVYYQKGAQAGLEAGDFLNVAWNYAHESYGIYLLGTPLPDASQEINIRSDAIRRLKQESHLIYNEILHQCVRNLLTPPEEPWNLTGDILNEEQMLAKVSTIQDTIALFFFYSCKFQLCYLLGRYEEGLKYAYLTMHSSTMTGCFPLMPVINFYMVLTHLALWEPSQGDRQLETIKVQYEKIKFWGNYGPMNHRHKFLLIEAEKQKNLGNKTEAIELYDRAIAGAKENEYLQEEALANELAAKFYLDWGKNRVAADYMIDAYYCYARWGAKAKTDDLEKRYPQLLQPIFQQRVKSTNLLDTLTNIAQPQLSIHSAKTVSHSSTTGLNATLDLAAVLKSSQALSEIIQLDQLLYQLSEIILENSGGDRCLILMPDDNNTWQIRAAATTNSTELCAEPLANNSSLPIKLIQYVKNTKEVLVLSNLDTDLPIIDNYLQQNQPQSILCLPMLNQGKLIGILYLQNQLTREVFTRERILILNFLCNQAAISIKNAQLHQKTELSLQQVKQSQNLLRKVIDTIPQYIFWKDRDSNFLGCNQKFATMAGVNSPEDIVGKNDYDLPWGREESDSFREDDRRVMESNQAQLHVITQRQVDGTTFWLDTNKMPLCDATREVYGILGSYEDISDRIRLEQKQKRLSAILEVTSDYVAMADTEGTILWMNAQFKKLRPELHYEGNSFKLTENHPQWVNEIILNEGFPIAGRDGIWFGETAVIDSTGREIPVSQIIIAHKSTDGVPEYFSSTMRDISQLKATETALREKSQALEQALQDLQKTQLQMVQSEKMSALGNLMAGFAHEINNPTGFLGGNIKYAQRYVEDLVGLINLYQSEYPQPTEVIAEEIEGMQLEFMCADLPKLLGSMNVAVERIRNISSSLRIFARKDQEYKTTFKIHEGIDSTLLILKHRTKATEKRPAIEIVREYGDIPQVECFPGQLNQVFMNILANAIDAFDEATLGKTFAQIKQKPNRIIIETSQLENNLVQIKIEDNGCGMKQQTKDRIFEQGFTTKAVGKGTGLGMAIAHQIITEKHGGRITCDSTFGEGTIFTITLSIA